MPLIVTCPSCAKPLRLWEEGAGKRLRCPHCGSEFGWASVAPEPAPPAEPVAARGAMTARRPAIANGTAEEPPPVAARRRREPDDDAMPPRKRRSVDVQTAPDEEEPLELSVDTEEERPRRSRRRGKKKRPFERPPDSGQDREAIIWPWWAFGGSAWLLAMSACLWIAVFADFDNPLKGWAAYMVVITPISAVIFFVAMVLSNVLLGGTEIGDLRVLPVKLAVLLFFVNLTSMIPYIGYLFTLAVWLVGLMTLFHADIWEARMMIFFNWVLNYGVKFLLMGIILNWAMHQGGSDKLLVPGAAPSKGGGVALRLRTWTERDVEARGGIVTYDPARPGEKVVIAILFRGRLVKDSDMAHMEDFPELRELDITDTGISDEGVVWLTSCRNLRKLIVSGTMVTAHGVEVLKRSTPELLVIK